MALAPCGGGRWPSIGTGLGGGGATRPTHCATAPSLGRGSGPWAPGGRRVVPKGGRTRCTPVTADDLLCSQEGVYPVPRRGRREGGAGYGRCPVQVGGGDPQDPLWVPAGRDDVEEQGGARAPLPEDLPSVVGTPGPGEGGG